MMRSQKLVFLFILLSNLLFAQSNEIKFLPKEQHFSSVTESVYSEKYQILFSAESSGKILQRPTRDFENPVLLKKANGFAISNLQLAKNDSLLIFKQLDTLYGINIFDKREILKMFSTAQIYKAGEYIVFKDFDKLDNQYIISIFNNNFKLVHEFKYATNIEHFAIAPDLSKIGFVSGKSYINQTIDIYDFKSKQLVLEHELNEKLRLDHFYFNDFSGFFELIVYDQNSTSLKLFTLDDFINRKSALVQTEVELTYFPKVTSKRNIDHYLMVYYTESQFSSPIILKRYNNKVDTNILKASLSHVSITSNELVFFEMFLGYNKFIKHEKYNAKDLSKIPTKLRESGNESLNAQFLEDDSWLVYQDNIWGNDLNFFKYFEKGTFYNRFHKFSFQEYLESKHQLVVANIAHIESKSGKLLLSGYKKTSQVNYEFFEYDLIKDQIKPLSNLTLDYRYVMDFNSSHNLVLFSKTKFVNGGYDDPSKVAVYQNGNLFEFEDNIKFGSFSKNGNYLLLIDENNRLSIRNVVKKFEEVYAEILPKAYLGLSTTSEALFIVNLFQYNNQEHNCFSSVKFFNLESGEVEVTENHCVNLTDVSYTSSNTAMIVNQSFLVVNVDQILKSFDKKMNHVSFNSSGDKFMVTYMDDMVEIFDTESLKNIGVMYHPDNKKHLFTKDEQFYFSNVNMDDYFNVFKDNQLTTWNIVPALYQNPIEILSMFGKPNLQYAEALQKAIDFKQNTNDITVSNNQSLSLENDVNQNLYVLSIGVSDYEQSDYSLTYADKDALDMIKIFGTFNEEQNSAYLNKFYGKKFHLKQDDSIAKTVNAYYEKYDSVGEFRPLNGSEYSWFSSYNEKFRFFDFDNNKIQEVKLPYQSSFYNIQYGITKNGSGFYTLNNQDLVTYNFNTGAISEEKLSEDINLYQYLNLNENEWVYSATNASILELNFINNQHVSTRKKVEVDLLQIPYQIKYEYDSHPCGYGCLATLESATKDGNNFIISINYPKEYYLIYKQNSKYEFLKLPVVDDEIKQLIKIQFSKNDQHIMVISEQENSHLYEVYDFNGTLINSLKLQKPQFFHKQIDYLNGVFFRIDFEEPLLDEDVLHFENHELFNHHKASSFNQVYTQYLTNDQATKKQIENSVTNFFKNIKPQDQVLVFMAGHGVLDDNNKYYYAPYNMDFNDVKRNGVSYDFIIDKLSSLPSQRKLLLMDTCHSGNVYDEVSGSNQEGQRGSKVRKASSTTSFKVSDVISSLYSNELSKNNLTVISASSGSDVAFEYKELGNGAFTHAFLKELKKQLQESMYGEPNWEKSVNLNQAFIDEVFKEVIKITNNKQTPDIREISTSSNLKVW